MASDGAARSKRLYYVVEQMQHRARHGILQGKEPTKQVGPPARPNSVSLHNLDKAFAWRCVWWLNEGSKHQGP